MRIDGRPGRRQRLAFWPLNDQRDALGDPIIVRDAPADFGPAGGDEAGWYIDHPCSAVVRLADGRWRTVMGMRIMVGIEHKRGSATIAPQTGCYLEEVLADTEPAAVWEFD